MNQHRIQTFILEPLSSLPNDRNDMGEQLSYLLKSNRFLSKLDEMLTEISGKDQYLSIDRLEIEFDYKDLNSFEHSFLNALKKQITVQQKEEKTQNKEEPVFLNKEDNLRQITLHFLQYGQMPWYASLPLIELSKQKIKKLSFKKDLLFFNQLLAAIQHSPAISARLLILMGSEGLKKMIKLHLNLPLIFLNQLESTITAEQTKKKQEKYFQKEQKEQQWQQILIIIEENKTAQSIRKACLTHSTENAPKPLPFRDENEKEVVQPTKEAATYIANAGVVLLWSGLSHLFKKIGLIEGENFQDTQKQQAMQLIHYLAYGCFAEWEDELVLNKVLCEWPIHSPVDCSVVPDDNMLTLADRFLADFSSLWFKDHQFSIDWLRQNFFQREGKLVLRPDDCWQLSLDRKTEDVLLNKLPDGWSYNIVKYSWMKHILFVNW